MLVASKGLQFAINAVANIALGRIKTEDEYKKAQEDAPNEIKPAEELIDIETALSLVKQGKYGELEVEAYEPFDLSKTPLRFKDPDKDKAFKEAFLEERPRQEAKINDAIVSSKLKAENGRVRIVDWEQYPDRLDNLITNALNWGYSLAAKGGKDDPLLELKDGEIGVRNRFKKAVKFLECLQVVQVKEYNLGKPDVIAIKDSIGRHIKETATELYRTACYSSTLLKIAERINQEMGFNTFEWTHKEITLESIKEVVRGSIEEHNSIIRENRQGRPSRAVCEGV